jgi:hypothetical protein
MRQELKAIGNLDRIRCALASPLSVGPGTLAADHADAGVCPQPRRQALGGAVRHQVDGRMTLKIYQDRAVPLAPSQRPSVDPADARSFRGRPWRGAHQAAERRTAGRQPAPAPQMGPGAATEREPHFAQRRQEGQAAAGAASGQSGNLLGEDAPRASRRGTAEAAYAPPAHARAVNDGQGSEPAGGVAVDPARGPAATRALTGSSRLAQVDGHAGISGNDLLDAPTGQRRERDRDAQRAPPAASCCPERTSFQYHAA